MGEIGKLVLAALACAALPAPAFALAADPVASAPAVHSLAGDLAEAEARDVFNHPEVERGIWQALYERSLAEDAAAELRARAALGYGIALYYAEQYEQSETVLDEALALAGPLGRSADPWRHRLLSYASLVAGERGKQDRSRTLVAEAMAAAIDVYGEDSAEAGLAHNATALTHWIAGDLAAARESMCRAADLARAHLPPGDFMVSNNMFSCSVVISMVSDDDDQVVSYLAEASAFALANLPPDHARMGYIFNSHTNMMGRLGRHGEVEALARKAINLFAEAGLVDTLQVQNVYSVLTGALFRQGKLEQARDLGLTLIAKAQETAAVSSPSLLANTYALVGQAHEGLGAHEAALASYRQALPLFADKAFGDPGRALTRARIANLLLQLGDSAGAAGEIAQALSIAENSEAFSDIHGPQLDLLHARYLMRSGEPAAAWEIARPMAEKQAGRLLDLSAKRSELVALEGILAPTMSETAYIALAGGRHDDAVRYAQLALLSELALADMQSGSRLSNDRPALAALVRELRQAERQSLNFQKQIRAIGASSQAEQDRLAQEEAANQAQIAGIRQRIAADWPQYTALLMPRLSSLEDIVASLDPGEALSLPITLDDRVVAILIDAGGLSWAETPLPRHALRKDVRALRQAFEFSTGVEDMAARFPVDASRRLHDALFPAALARPYARASRVLMPASGAFSTIPAASLLSEDFDPSAAPHLWPWLLAKKSVQVRVGLAGKGDAAHAAQGGRRFLGVGDPKTGFAAPAGDVAELFRGTPDAKALASLPTLPGTGRELRAIARTLGDERGLVLTGDAATEAAIRDADLTAYDVLAFATHGLVSGEINGLLEPALVLTPIAGAGSDNDGLLTASEIAALRISAEWVILSACNTGAGDSAASPSYSGLARAFRQAGARSLLLSHWRVRDDVAARLTVATVGYAAEGMDRAEALRRAQLELMRDPDLGGAGNPALWASFVLIDG